MARGRRYAARDPLSGAYGLRDPFGLPQSPALRPRGRRGGTGGRELGQAKGGEARAAQERRPDRDRARRGHRHQDADRRRLRRPAHMRRAWDHNPTPSLSLPLYSALVGGAHLKVRRYDAEGATRRSAMNWSNSALSLA